MNKSHLELTKDMTYSASTLQEILDIIFLLKAQLATPLWFRGQGPYYNLTPSILRNKKMIRDQYGRKRTTPTLGSGSVYAFPDQFKMIEEFKRLSDHSFKKNPASDYDWLCIMQHYGIPTKLLDWTVDPMIALFFATDISKDKIKERNNEEYGAELWILPPIMLNEHSQFRDQNIIFPPNDRHVEAFLGGDGNFLPIAIEAPHIEERLILQKCCFTMHGYDVRPLNHMCHHNSGFLYKIEIPVDALHGIKDSLISFGHTHGYYYPNDDTKYAHIRDNELKKFFSWYEEYEKELCKDRSQSL